MGTKVYGAYRNFMTTGSGGYNKVRAWFDYTVAVNDATKYRLTLYSGLQISGNALTYTQTVPHRIAGTGRSTKSSSKSINSGEAQTTTIISSFNWTWSKTHEAQSITVSAYNGADGTAFVNDKAKKTFTIPAKTSYAVTYNANGGTGAPSSQTKWYDETLTLSSVKPTRADSDNKHYTFKGWATSSSGSVVYASGATYTANAGLSLYAVWEVEYKAPQIGKVTAVRAKSNGTEDDEGTYVNISFPWSVDNTGYLDNRAQQIQIKYRASGATTWTTLVTASQSAVSGTYVATARGSGRFDTNTFYELQITLTDAYGSTTVTAFVSSAYFVIDVAPNGYGIGLGTPALEGSTRDDAVLALGLPIWATLDVTIPSGSSQATSGRDMLLYNAVVAFGWTGDVIVND